jgi:hypothetical protein
MTAKHKKSFYALNCDSMEYTLTCPPDKFKLEEFKKDIAQRGAGPQEVDDEGTLYTVLPTRNFATTDYHVHFSCRWERGSFRASLEYIRGTEKPETHEKGPFAEELMEWLGQFFTSERVTAEVEGTFTYSRKKCEPTLPIPMRLRLSSVHEVEIFSVSVGLFNKPEGVYRAYVGAHDDLVVVVSAQRRVHFKEFDVHRDTLSLSTVAKMFARDIKG